MKPKQHDRTKLPKWAQHEMEMLEMFAREAEARANKLKALADGAMESNTYIENYDKDNHLLPPSSEVNFKVGRGIIAVKIATDGESVRVFARSRYAEIMAIYPKSGNYVELGWVDY